MGAEDVLETEAQHVQDALQKRSRLQKRRAVFLQVAIVSEWQAFNENQQRLQIYNDPRRLAASQLQHVRIDLLRHDR